MTIQTMMLALTASTVIALLGFRTFSEDASAGWGGFGMIAGIIGFVCALAFFFMIITTEWVQVI